MNVPIRQHYNPRMLLKRFVDKDDRLHFFTKHAPDKGVLTSTPKNLFLQKHLYTQVDKAGTKDVSVATSFLANLEGKADPIIEKIVCAARRRQTPNLSHDEKDVFLTFFYLQLTRVPDVRDTIMDEVRHDTIEEIQNKANFRPLTYDEREMSKGGEEMERLLKNASIQSLPMGLKNKAFRILSEKHMCVAVIPNPTPMRNLVIGSYPVVKLSYPGRSFIGDPSVQVWLHLAHDVAIAFNSGECERVKVLKPRHIQALNESGYKQSTMIAGRSYKLIESLTSEESRRAKSQTTKRRP